MKMQCVIFRYGAFFLIGKRRVVLRVSAVQSVAIWLYQIPDSNMHKISEANIAENDVDFKGKVC